MHIRTKKKLSNILITAALLTPLALPVQAKFIERQIESPDLTPIQLVQADHTVIAEQAIINDLRGPSSVKDVTLSVNAAGQLVIRNNTVRKFHDMSAIVDGIGITVAQVVAPRSSLTLDLANIQLSADSKISWLEPYGVFSPNANGFHDNLEKDIWVEVYADIQRNMMKFYSRAETFDQYRDFFRITRGESLSDTLGKWHKTATYDIPKNYRKAHKAAGLAGGSWLGLAAYTLDRSFTITDYIYTSHYGTFSHEYGHTMGFKHGSGMAYGWDDPVRAEMRNLLENGTVNRAAAGDEPTTHEANFYLHFNEEQGLGIYQKPGSEFHGLDWIKIVYDDAAFSLSESELQGERIKFDVVKKTNSKLLFNARLTDQSYMANLTYQGQDPAITLGMNEYFIPKFSEDSYSGLLFDSESVIQAPTEMTEKYVSDLTNFSFPVTSETGEQVIVNATADRSYAGCSWLALETAGGCTRQQSFDINIKINVSMEDNPALQEGRYTGSLTLNQIDYFNQDQVKAHVLPVKLAVFTDPTPAKFDAEQAKFEQDRLDLVADLPIIGGTLPGNALNLQRAYQLDFNGEMKTLCYMNGVDNSLEVETLLGFVENGECNVGENNSYNQTKGYSSSSYGIFDRYSVTINGNGQVQLTLPESGLTTQICYRSDDPWTGVGFYRNGRCESNMLASNGRNWGFGSSTSATFSRDTLDQLPVNHGWVLPTADITPLTAKFDQGEAAVCRFSIFGTQLFGYVKEDQCTIGDNNIWQDIQSYSSAAYQVVDAQAERQVQNVKVTVGPNAYFTEAIDLDLCFRPEADVAGVGFSSYGSQCMQHDRGVKKSTGKNWYFGYTSGSPKVTWQYALRADDIWTTAKGISAYTVTTSAGAQTVCRFAANEKAHYGLVSADGQCEIGATNSLNGQVNYRSETYQVIDVTDIVADDKVMFKQEDDSLVQLCSRTDGIGFSIDGVSCEQEEVLNKDNQRWHYAANNTMAQYAYKFPVDTGWVSPSEAVAPIIATTAVGDLTICRTNYQNRTIMGFVVDDTCKINDDLNIEGNTGYSNANYQIIDGSLGISGQAVTVTWEDNVEREICYRPTAKWRGVGYRGNQYNRCRSNLTTDSGSRFYFSNGNTMILFP